MKATSSWFCTVCGYVHEGDAPPECCPICGATSDLFEPLAETTTTVKTENATHWRCLNCDYVHAGDAPLKVCPVCAAGQDKFEAFSAPEEPLQTTSSTLHIVIAGAGVSGISAAEAARKTSPDAKITVLSREKHHPYYRLNLTRFLAGEIDDRALPIHSPEWYSNHRIELLLESELQSIDPEAHSLQLRNRTQLSYDRLILALGAHPFVPPIPGVNRENVTTLRTRSDAETLLERVTPNIRCVVIGGGVLGLEAAAALVRRGARVSLLEGFGWLLPRQLNRRSGELLAEEVRTLGIDLITDARIKSIDGDEQVRSVVLESSPAIPADLVLITAGVRSNTYLARLAGLEVKGGIVVDNHLQTSHPDIFAVGDASEHLGVSYGTWAPAQYQGAIAGMNAAGANVAFAGIPRSNMLKVLDVELFSIGNVHPDDGSYLTFELQHPERYAYLVFRDSRLEGAILLGDTRLSTQLKNLIEKQVSCADFLKKATTAEEMVALLAGD